MSINVNVPFRLITAQYNYTLNGMRLRDLILSKLAPEDYPNQTDMIISVDEWVNAYSSNKSGALKSMLAGAKSIQTSPLFLRTSLWQVILWLCHPFTQKMLSN